MPRPKRNKVGSSHAASKPAILHGVQQQSTATQVAHDEENEQRAGTTTRRYPKSNSPRTFSSALNYQREAQRPQTGGDDDTNEDSGNESRSPEVEMGRRRRERLDDENSVLAFGNFRRRQRQPSILGRGAKARSSSIDSDLGETRPADVLRMENSVLAMSAMRKRPRQPSILGKGIRARSSSAGLEMLGSTPGNVTSSHINRPSRKRQKQSDTLGSREKDTQRGTEYESAEEDFDPEDESTPLKLSKSATAPDGESHSVPSTSKSRKRKLSSHHSSISTLPPLQHLNSDIDESLSTRSSPAPPRNRRITPELLSETMAPPQSSSSGASSYEEVRSSNRIVRAATTTLATRRRPLRKAQRDDPPSSPPSLTHSPNRPTIAAITRTRSRPPAPTLSTAQLQALLPRRRRRQHRDTFDILSSDEEEIDVTGLGSDDDELSHLTLATNRNSRRSPISSRRVTKLKSANKANSKPASRSARFSKRTYGSHLASDKENVDDGEAVERDEEVEEGDSLGPILDDSVETSQELEERVGKALKNAKKKFENVDKWELEFEDFTAGSSSPWDAR